MIKERAVLAKHIEAYFDYMGKMGASDLHLASGAPANLRIHGEMQPIGDQVLTAPQIVTMLKEIMSVEDIRKLGTLKNMDFAVQWNDPGPVFGKRYRANVFIQKNGPNIVFRAITTKIPTFAELGLPKDLLRFTQFHQGLVLVTGATGSGKTSTLAALINHINETRAAHIITVEDPIEYVHTNKKSLINQRELGRDVESFPLALKGALREDPDVILIGELRDLETIQLAVTAAETGHVVFGTMHTNSASKTIDRIIDSFPAEQQAQVRTMLSESLKGVVAQQLIPRADGKGRVAALEILIGNLPMANLIREAKTFQIPSMIQVSKSQGMILMDDYVQDLLNRGLITKEEAIPRMVGKPQPPELAQASRIGAR
jgi:twitching motility protein PilT